MFEAKHLILLLCSGALICGLVWLTRKWDLYKRSKALLILGLVSETVKIFSYIVINEDTHGGVLPKTDLPFQLCSLQIIFALIVCITKQDAIRRTLLAFMIPSALVGGLAAILLPTNSSLTVWPITFQYYIYHAALIAFAIRLIADKEFQLTFRDYVNCLKFLVGLMFFSFYMNSIVYDGNTNVNFMYVVSPPVAGLPFLNENHGWLVYIFHYACLVFGAVTVCYIKPIYQTLRARCCKDAVEQ